MYESTKRIHFKTQDVRTAVVRTRDIFFFIFIMRRFKRQAIKKNPGTV